MGGKLEWREEIEWAGGPIPSYDDSLIGAVVTHTAFFRCVSCVWVSLRVTAWGRGKGLGMGVGVT